MFMLTLTGEYCRYWDLGDKQIANNSRAGSVSVYFAIANSGIPFAMVSKATKPVYMLVREPVDRFLSAKRKEQVEAIYPGTGNHFDLQSKLAIGPKVFLYRFPDQLEQFGKDTGLEISWFNKSTSAKPVLTETERQRVLEQYAPDVELYQSIK